jgi:hypothetical protein
LPGGCDGLVAVNPGSPSPDPKVNPNNDLNIKAAYLTFAPWELAQATDNPDHSYVEQDNQPGTDSPTGCGSNSRYELTWSFSRLD